MLLLLDDPILDDDAAVVAVVSTLRDGFEADPYDETLEFDEILELFVGTFAAVFELVGDFLEVADEDLGTELGFLVTDALELALLDLGL